MIVRRSARWWRWLIGVDKAWMTRPLFVQEMLPTTSCLFTSLQKLVKDALGNGRLIINAAFLLHVALRRG